MEEPWGPVWPAPPKGGLLEVLGEISQMWWVGQALNPSGWVVKVGAGFG